LMGGVRHFLTEIRRNTESAFLVVLTGF
jgi:hypothetical protein